jgi:hypothetical protein
MWWLLLPLFIGLVAVVVSVLYLVERQRTQKIQQAAEELGLTFTTKPDAVLLGGFSGFDLFARGHLA